MIANNLLRSILWKLLELAFICLFVFSLYAFENHVINYIIQNEHRFGYLKDLYAILFGLKNNFLPCKMWLLTWPFLIVSMSLILFKQLRWYFIGIMGILTTIMLSADKLNYTALSSLITLSSFKIINQLWDIKYSILELLKMGDILKIFYFLLFFVLGFVFNKYTDSSLQANPKSFAIDKIFGVLFFMLFINSYNSASYIEKRNIEWLIDENNNRRIIIHPLNENYDTEQWKGKQHFSPPFQSSNLDYAVSFGIINFHIKNISDSIRYDFMHRELKPDELDSIVNWLYEKKRLNDTKSPLWGIAKGRNIFLVAVESLSPGVIGLVVDNVFVTPTLNHLKSDALCFNRIVDQDHSGGSSDSEFALMTGLLPSRQYLSSMVLPETISLIGMPDILRKAGYNTFSFHGNKASFWNRNINHPSYGIQKMFFKDSFNKDRLLGMGIPDDIFFIQSVEFLSNQSEPFFAYLITLSSHHPYQEIPFDYQVFFKQLSYLNPELIGYLEIIKYTDDAIGKFLQAVKENDLWENSAFIFYGDHIPPMNSESIDIYKKLTSLSLRDYKDIRIPLLILIPGKEETIRNYQEEYADIIGDQHDIFPTILHLVGIDIPFGVSGTHLFVSNPKRDPLFLDNEIFIFNGIIYHGPTGLSLSANFSTQQPPYAPVNVNKTDVKNVYLKSYFDMMNHTVLYDFDAQSKAIEVYRLKNFSKTQTNSSFDGCILMNH